MKIWYGRKLKQGWTEPSSREWGWAGLDALDTLEPLNFLLKEGKGREKVTEKLGQREGSSSAFQEHLNQQEMQFYPLRQEVLKVAEVTESPGTEQSSTSVFAVLKGFCCFCGER